MAFYCWYRWLASQGLTGATQSLCLWVNLVIPGITLAAEIFIFVCCEIINIRLKSPSFSCDRIPNRPAAALSPRPTTNYQY